MSVFYMIRGLPGSGKSTFAKKLAGDQYGKVTHYETDQYFVDPVTNEYKFEANRIRAAHEWCFGKFSDHIRGQMGNVVVSNTFTEFWEMESYFAEAMFHEWTVIVITMLDDFGNVHNVPQATLDKMRNRFLDSKRIRVLADAAFNYEDLLFFDLSLKSDHPMFTTLL